MAYKNILVHIDEAKNASAILEVACKIALQNDACLTGIFVVPHINTPVPIYAEVSLPASIIQAQEEAVQAAAAQAEILFKQAIKHAGCNGEWLSPKGYVDEQINLAGRYADLIVIGQPGPEGDIPLSFPIENQIILGSSRPVLFVPYSGFSGLLGRNVLVAWNGSKEVCRAINDALPILQKADDVQILSINPSPDQGENPAADICQFLARHDVKAEASQLSAENKTTTELLLDWVTERGSDLIVMGAYGHSRLREFILGGATYSIQRNMTVPILMSH